MQRISICSVNYQDNNILYENIKCFAQYNNEFHFDVFITNNTEFTYDFSSVKNITYHRVKGVDKKDAICTLKEWNRPELVGRFKHSLHHGTGLDKAIDAAKKQNNDYTILTDADCIFFEKLLNVFKFIDNNQYSIIGTRYRISVWPNLPNCIFIILSKNILDIIKIDVRQQNYDFKQEYVDTSLPLRQITYKFKYFVFNICVSKECFICQNLLDKDINYYKFGFGSSFERFFFNNKLVGVHFHTNMWKNSNYELSQYVNSLYSLNKRCYHPINNLTDK